MQGIKVFTGQEVFAYKSDPKEESLKKEELYLSESVDAKR